MTASTIVRLGGVAEAAPPAPALDDVLLAALPPARQVLEIGASSTALRSAYQRCHPGVTWTDEVDAGTRYDLVIVGDVLQRLPDPLGLLRDLAAFTTPDATLVLVVANGARLATVEQLLESDFSAVDGGPFASDNLRVLSPASTYKLLLDAGWMPSLAAQQSSAPPTDGQRQGLYALADAFGVPRATAERRLRLERLVITARTSFGTERPPAQRALFSVIVPTTRELQLRLNIDRSPGLREVDAQVIAYRGAASPAQALEAGATQADSDWLLFCHQDVYFPTGFGQRLNEVLAAIAPEQRRHALIGFAGIGVNAQRDGYAPAGFVIDRLDRFDHPASAEAISIDELAIVVARDSVHRIDPRLGWHLWATDLSLSAITQHRCFARIVRLPLFHNSLNDHTLPASFRASATVLAEKHASFGPIPTLCGTIGAAPVARQRPRPRGRSRAPISSSPRSRRRSMR